MQEVVRAEVLKLLQVGIIYPYQIAHGTTSLPFIDQVLERVSGHPFYYFLDGYSGYFQIEIDVEDQEKTTFTCPFEPTHTEECLSAYAMHHNIPKMHEKCHFMVHQGIVLGHIISKQGIEVDKAKVELIVKLPSPTTVKGVRQFLGHAGFYRRSFEELKLFLTTAPIVRAPNWQLPFEVMCDASDFAIGAVLGQREDGKPYVIYYEQNDAKARLIRWILLLQEFNLHIKDKKGVENVESLMLMEVAPWYAHIANYLVTEKFQCVPEQEQQGILSHCHESACGGHFASQKTSMKVLQSGFWPSLFKDAHTMCRSCDRCRGLGS
ncbi:hypothetical protein CK203_109807 [Vitis vinifera]|uniref:Retrovirus-related Pol polyprotein from transposon 17.6 n=1 Tax=Vitis vinifera TaxID=29760 RepID=A0A438FE20_VITVI|nr:hypothetical protein CK203_109807 [Vitis vinifera]